MGNSDDINAKRDEAHTAAQAAVNTALPLRNQSPAAMTAFMTLLDARNSLYLSDLTTDLSSPDLAQALAVISNATTNLTTMASHMTDATSVISGAANFSNQAQVVVTAYQNAQAKTA